MNLGVGYRDRATHAQHTATCLDPCAATHRCTNVRPALSRIRVRSLSGCCSPDDRFDLRVGSSRTITSATKPWPGSPLPSPDLGPRANLPVILSALVAEMLPGRKRRAAVRGFARTGTLPPSQLLVAPDQLLGGRDRLMRPAPTSVSCPPPTSCRTLDGRASRVQWRWAGDPPPMPRRYGLLLLLLLLPAVRTVDRPPAPAGADVKP
jgi:hypothetical protein